MENYGLKKRIINDMGYGGWLEWQYPNQVFIDGRLEVIQEDFYKEYLESVNNGKLSELISKYNPELVIFNHGTTISWISQMTKLKDWRLIYLDENTAVFGKKTAVTHVTMNIMAEFFKGKGFRIDFTREDIDRILAIEPGFKKSDWFAGFYKQHNQYLNMIDFALFSLEITRLKEAELMYLNVLDKSNGKLEPEILKELYFNLGTIYHYNKNYANALKCYEHGLRYDPTNPDLLRRIPEVKSLKETEPAK